MSADTTAVNSTVNSPEVSALDLEKLDQHINDGFDKGTKAWLTLLGGFLVTLSTFGYANAFGVYQDVYTRAGAASAQRISWVGSTQLFFLFAIGLPAGKLLDMGYFRWTNLIGTLIFVFSLFMVSIAHQDKYYQIYLSQGLGLGIGAGLLYVPAMAVQAHHWREKRAFAMGIVITGTSVGGIIFPIMLNQLFKSSVGFEWGVRASAFLCLGLLIISNLIMSTNPAVLSETKPKPDIKAILTDVPYLLASFGVLIVFLGLFYPFFYLQLFSVLHGIKPEIAFYAIAILNAGSMPGRIIPGLIANKIGPMNGVVSSTIICAGLVFAMFGVKSVGSMVAFALFYGFFSGAMLSFCSPALASFAKDPNEIGARFGITFFICSFGVLFGPPADGALLGHTFPWFKAIIFSGAVIAAGGIVVTIARFMFANAKGRQAV